MYVSVGSTCNIKHVQQFQLKLIQSVNKQCKGKISVAFLWEMEGGDIKVM